MYMLCKIIFTTPQMLRRGMNVSYKPKSVDAEGKLFYDPACPNYILHPLNTT